MKKQTNLFRPHAGKLSLNKKTISNLQPSEMNKMIGGSLSICGGHGQTYKNGNTCLGHKTCYNC